MRRGISNITDTYRYVFFDFDGVILDSLPAKKMAFYEVFKQIYDEDIARAASEYNEKQLGLSRYEKFAYIAEYIIKCALSDADIRRLDNALTLAIQRYITVSHFVPGVTEFIKQCHMKGCLNFIVSAAPQRDIRAIVSSKKLVSYFSAIKGSPCTKDENIAAIIDAYSLSRRQCIFFGDTEVDERAARNAAIDFIGIDVQQQRYCVKDFLQFV